MYCYPNEKPKLFTEEGSVMFTKIRDRVKTLLVEAGAFSMGAAMRASCGDTWMMMACVDRMVEIGELVEVTHPSRAWGQHRVFTQARPT